MPMNQSARVRQLRLALGYDKQVAWCQFLGIGVSRWNNIEAGGRRVPMDVATLMVQRIPGLTFDWIFNGDPSGLTLSLAVKLGEGSDGGARRAG